MFALTPLAGNLKERALQRLEQTAKEILPARVKRMMFVSSITGLMRQITDPNEELVARLNEVFKAVHYQGTITATMKVKAIIWRKINPTVELNGRSVTIAGMDKMTLTDDEAEQVASYFATNVPSWMRYGSRELMIHDVKEVMHQMHS